MRKLLASVLTVTFFLGSVSAANASGANAPAPGHDYAEAIRELVRVDTGVDSDGDGRRDRVAAYVIRPAATERGYRAPVIVETDPYWAGLVPVDGHPADVTTTPQLAPWTPPASGRPSDYSGGYYDNYFVPRGYAVVEMASLGTGDSDGCPGTGSRAEGAAVRAMAAWLTGRGTAVDAAGRPARADWSTGSLALVGLSYGGSLALAGATAPGVRAVVASAAVTDWYRYYRANGAHAAARGAAGDDADVHTKLLLTRADPAECAPAVRAMEAAMDHASGDRNAFWDERDLTRRLGAGAPAVFLVAGLNDDYVRPGHSTRLWRVLERAGVERRMWLHLGGHDDPLDVRGARWLRLAERYFGLHLRGVDSGLDRGPLVSVEQAPGRWSHHRTWPAPGVRGVRVGGSGPAGFVDDPSRTADELVARGSQPAFTTRPLSSPTRLSGSVELSVRVALDGPSPYLTALLVDYGDAARVTGREATDRTWCFAAVTEQDAYGCRPVARHRVERAPFRILSRGWVDVRNRASTYEQRPIVPRRHYTVRWSVEPTDHVIPAGHRLGVVLISTDREHTLRYPGGTRVTVDLARSSARLPLVRR